jgi:hypothetical protein
MLLEVIPRYALELRVQTSPQLVLAYPEGRRVSYQNPQTLEDLLDPSLASDLLDTLRYHRPNPGPAHDVPHALQLTVSPDDRVGRYLEVFSQPADRRQPLPGAQASDLDRMPYLIHDLDVDRNPTARFDVDPNSYSPHLLRVIVAYL